MTSVALVRGINVGGRNRVPMRELAAGLAARGCTGVATYIASGNILLDDTAPPEQLARTVAATMLEEFEVDARVLVRPGDQVRAIAAAIPEHWTNQAGMRADVLYLWDAVDDEAVLSRLPARPGVDETRYTPGALLWAVPVAMVNRSGLRGIFGSDLYPLVTVRNVNTARTLARLVAERDGRVGPLP
jgi:uncharacterized protein (DUF1697 family)